MYIRHPDKFYINGQWVAPTSNARISVFNSATEEEFLSVAVANERDVQRAVSAARNAFDRGAWPRLTHRERGTYLRALAEELDRKIDQHSRIWTMESGVLFRDSRSRIEKLTDTYRYYADISESFRFEEEHQPQNGGDIAYVVREPVGVVAAIVAWNGAPGLITTKVAPALLAGCTVVLKLAPEAPGSGYLLAEACEAAGLPAGVLNILTADREVSEYLVRHPVIDKVTFTGSTAAGRRIAAICGERLARCTLELGGKSPALILDDFNVETAASHIASRIAFMSGQVCYALTRVIVSRHRHDETVSALSEHFRAITVGDPFENSSQMGPLASAAQRARVEGYIERGKSSGAVLAAGGGRPPNLDRGYYVLPTIFANVDENSEIAQEEIFGPVLSVIPADDEQHAIAIANNSKYGLNAVIFTNDNQNAYNLARQLRSGTVGHNGLRREHRLPFGGFKQSGLGREGGKEGLFPYLETKVIILDRAQ